MKALKGLKALKKIAVFSILFFCGVCCYAATDLQFQLGGIKSFAFFDGLDGKDKDFSQAGLSFSLEVYQLFEKSTPLCFGFFGDFSYTGEYREYLGSNDYYSAYTVKLITGPAVGYKLNKLFKLQGQAGVLLGYRTYDTPVYDSPNAFSKYSAKLEDKWTFGVAAGLEAKCFWDFFLSPIVGARYEYTYCNVFDSDVNTHSFIFFTGLCFNIDTFKTTSF